MVCLEFIGTGIQKELRLPSFWQFLGIGRGGIEE